MCPAAFLDAKAGLAVSGFEEALAVLSTTAALDVFAAVGAGLADGAFAVEVVLLVAFLPPSVLPASFYLTCCSFLLGYGLWLGAWPLAAD